MLEIFGNMILRIRGGGGGYLVFELLWIIFQILFHYEGAIYPGVGVLSPYVGSK